MARIYRLNERIKYKFGEIEVEISPLSLHDKTILQSFMVKAQNGDFTALMTGSAQAIKLAVKSVKGIEDSEGNPYELTFDPETNHLTDECVADLMNLSESPQLISLCSQFIAGVPNQLPKGISLVEDGTSPNGSKGKKQSKSSGS